MFDDEDSDDKEDEESDDKESNALKYKLENPGTPDGPLSYGIQFIQNALRSWAQQRLTAQYTQAYLHQQQQARNEVKPQRRGPGRPRKFDSVDEEPRPAPLPPSTIQMDLAKTSEGAAIAAFREVLDCGCLKVNAILPIELTRALRHLYMQIDHLINQGARNEPQWQCMSYGAQIAAQKARVDKWKADQAKAQEEMARQHHLAQQQMMQQMGIPPHQRGPLSAEQAQQHHAIELERRRSLQQAAQQPHLTQYLTNPMSLNNQSQDGTSGPSPSRSPANGASASSPGAATANGPSVQVPHGLPTQTSSVDPKGVQLDKIKLYMPNFLPRSGQSMKFSFAPHSELALKTFGAQAFPTNHARPNLPNRGPMSTASPAHSVSISHSHAPNSHGPTLVLGSNAPTPAPQESRRSASANFDVTMTNGSPPSHTTDSDTKQAVASHKTTPKEATNSFSSFRAVNVPNTDQRPRSASSGHGHAISPVKPSIELSNGMHVFASVPASPASAGNPAKAGGESKTADLASRFPHPGAIVVDQ